MDKTIKKVGNIFPSDYETGDVLDPDGISKTLKKGIRDAQNTQIPKIVVDEKPIQKIMLSHTKANIKKRIQDAELAWTLDATGANQGIILKVGKTWEGQSGIVYDADGLSPTLPSKGTGKTGGNAPIIAVLDPTIKFLFGLGKPRKGLEKDYEEGRSRGFQQPQRVFSSKGLCPTLSGQESQGRYNVLVEENNRILDSNDVFFVKRTRNEYGKMIRKDYEKGTALATMKEIREWAINPQKISNTLSGVQLDNLIVDSKIFVVEGNNKEEKKLVQRTMVSALKAKNQDNPKSGGTTLIVESALIHSRGLETRTDGVSYALKGGGGGSSKNFIVEEQRVEVLGNLDIIVKKRIHDTPKEINEYLRKARKKRNLSLKEISSKMDLPKTQVEHYFRTDEYRSIPSTENWLKLKFILNLDDRYDKQVMDLYEKQMEYEMTRRVHSIKGLSPSLKGGSSSKNFVIEKSLDTKIRIIRVGNLWKESQMGTIYSPMGLSPALQSQENRWGKANTFIALGMELPPKQIITLQGDYGNRKVTIKDEVGVIPSSPTSENLSFVVSGLTTGNSQTSNGNQTRKQENSSGKDHETTQEKSIRNTGTMEHTSMPTSVQSTLTQSPITTFSPRVFLANLSRSRVNGKVSKILVERFSTRFAVLRRLKDLSLYSLRTSGDFSVTMKDLRSKSSSNRWRTWGIGSNGKYLTANILFHRIGKGSSLSDILEDLVEEKYFLSSQTMESLLKHKERHEEKGHGFGLQIHSVLEEASRNETL